MKILIDGYNLVAELWGMGQDAQTLAKQRDRLIAMLGAYHALRGHQIEVVFDGWKRGDPMGGRTIEGGVLITFSPLKVTADEVIRDMLENRGPGTLVVSSDRQVRSWASHAGADSVDSAGFIRRINAVRGELTEDGKDAEDADDGWDGSTKKRGNPRRLPKRERGTAKRLKKL